MATIYIGTSGFSYREWMGKFYPRTLKNSELLSYYATQFNTVEINNTFYRIPSAEALDSWGETVGPDFVFTVKANQKITHRKDFGIPGGEFELFLSRVSVLKRRLGPVLFQFPPAFGKPEKLMEFIQELRTLLTRHRSIIPVIELRNKKLLDREFLQILWAQGVNLCFNDAFLTPDEWPEPLKVVYLRLRNGPYEKDFLKGIGASLKRWADHGRDCYVFFKHEIDAPEMAREMLEILK